MSTNKFLRDFKCAWSNFIERHSNIEEHRFKVLKQAVDWLLVQEKYDAELLDTVSRNISQLHDDWIFLDHFAIYMYWEDANCRIQKEVCKLGFEIQSAISSGDKYLKRPQELLSILLECRRKTDRVLRPEIGDCVEDLITLNLESAMNLIMKNVTSNVVLIKSADVSVEGYNALINELLRIQMYMQQHFWTGMFKSKSHPLTSYLASVVGKIASKSFNVWINRHDTEIAKARATELVELGHQITSTNPEFMKLLLNYQVAIHVYRQYKLGKGSSDFVYDFCKYLLTSSLNENYRYQVLREELRSLVNIYVLNTLQVHSSREDLSSLFLEIEAVLREISILHGNEDIYTLSDRLLLKVRILKMELFIKKQLISSSSFIDGDLLMETIKGFVKDLPLQIDPECDDKQYLTFATEMNDMVESLPWSQLQSEEHTNFLVKCSLRKLLYKIVFFKAENALLELPKKCTTSQSGGDSLIVCASEDQIPFLEKELKHVKHLVASQLMWTSPEEEVIFIQIEELARRITLLSHSTLPDNDKDVFLSLSQLSSKMKYIKVEIREISPPFELSEYPKILKLSFIKYLGRNIKELLKRDLVSIAPLRHHLKQVEQQLHSLGSLLMKASFSPLEVENGCLMDIDDRIRDTIHKIEYTVESVELDSQSKYSFWLYNLLEDMAIINQQVSNVVEKCHADRLGNSPWVSREILSKDTISSSNNEITVALAAEEEVIISQLIRGSSQRDIVSIVGMAGIGKSTLARKVYSSKHVLYHFSCCAWCAVSQVYSKRELLLDILSDIHGITNEIQQMSEEDLRSKMRRCLLGNRYLIILDDLWDITVWNYLEMSFPNDRNGSRILITSRLQNLHSKIQPGSNPHLKHLFSDEESWMLLERKIFEEDVCCPKELLLLGKQIAHHCQGLPLAILAISGLLRKTEKARDWWEEISKSLCTQVINDPENQCKEILELSYKHLPDDLKACFLHLGVFLADKDIPMSKLIQLWIAEGFIQEAESRSLEEVALDYAMELINRSLVIISRKKSNGRVKACHLHDLLRDLCQSKAKDENFLNLVSRFDEPFASFPDSEYHMEFYSQDLLDPATFESYRLSINLIRNHFIDSRPSGPITRSLLFFASADKEPKCPYEVSFICKNFRLLRVLDLECINMGFSFPDEFGLMIHLRYLGVSGYLRSIPSSIANLWKLQFLVVKGFRGTIILPYSIWSMGNLRHLHVNEHVSFDLEGDDELSGSLDNLVSFSTPLLSLGSDTTNLLRRLPNLLKMRCIFLEPRNSSKSDSQFPILTFLTRMESLKIIYIGRAFNAGEFFLPLCLKKLTLSGFPLSWNHMSKIGGLPNLRVFKLLSATFEGPKWQMEEDEFKQLEFLKLENLNIAQWAASDDHLPNLIRLVLRNCHDLEEIPKDFACICTLEIIEVQWCGIPVEESAKRIAKITEDIKVVINYN